MNRQLMIFFGAALGIVLLWFFLLEQPAAQKQALINAELIAIEAKLEDYRSTVADLPSILAQQNRLLSSRAELSSKLFAKNDILELFRQLDTDVRAHELRITEISPPVHELLALNQKLNTPDEPLFLNIRLTIRGGFLNFGQYVQGLEKAPYFRGVNRCTISSTNVPGDPTMFTIDFRALLGSTEAAS
jgi:hypothetical protein